MTGMLTATDVRAAYARRDILAAGSASAAPDLARACHAMAGRFARGGRLLAFGSGCAAADAAHVVVEFAHPVIVGKRALPAMRLADPAAVGLFGAPDDIAMGIAADDDGPVAAGLASAAGLGLLVLMGAIATYLVLTAGAGAPRPAATHGAGAAQAGAWSPGRR